MKNPAQPKVVNTTAKPITYDINVLVLLHYAEQYRFRLEVFKRLGLANIKGKVHITLLSSLGDAHQAVEILAGWPEGIDITLLEGVSQHPIPKIVGYYLWLVEGKLEARWHIRVDDDSWSDIGGILDYVDREFGDVPVHLMTPWVHHGDHMFEVIKELDLKISGIHEYECSVTSGRAMNLLYKCDRAMHFLVHVVERYTYPGDLPLAWAMQVTGVPCLECHRFSKSFDKTKLSLAGGTLLHIHYVSWEDTAFRLLLEDLMYGHQAPFDATILSRIVGRSLQFGRGVGHVLSELEFNPKGRIGGIHDQNESYWMQIDNVLVLQSRSREPKTMFARVLTHGSRVWLLGRFTENHDMHYLRVE